MTRLLEAAVQTARTLSPEMQDDIARMVLLFAGRAESQSEDGHLTAEDEAAVLRSRTAADRGEFATDEEIKAVWSRHGL